MILQRLGVAVTTEDRNDALGHLLKPELFSLMYI